MADDPAALPEPSDDGSADHLPGTELPSIGLPATDGTAVDLAATDGRVVVYCYPKTGRPDRDVVPDGWDEIPGARGCTPEACGFRDHHDDLRERGVDAVFGLSVQSTGYQREARDRLGLPYELLSDEDLAFAEALDLPTFAVDGETYHDRRRRRPDRTRLLSRLPAGRTPRGGVPVAGGPRSLIRRSGATGSSPGRASARRA